MKMCPFVVSLVTLLALTLFGFAVVPVLLSLPNTVERTSLNKLTKRVVPY